MSYILEALRKAEQQRRLGDAPGLDDMQPVEAPVKPRWMWGWVLLGVMNVILLALLFWPDGMHSTGDVAQVSSNTSDTVNRSVRSQSVQQDINQQPPSIVAQIEPQVEVANTQTIQPPLKSIPPSPPMPETIKPGRVVQSETVIEPDAAAINKQVESSDLPVWPQLPANILGQLGDGLKLDVHVYADRAEERFVLINLQKYREGDQLSEGPILETVTPEGTVMSFQGERFRINAK